MSVPDLPAHAWAALLIGALLVGFAKTAVGGFGSLAVVAFAAVLPAKESTGALLPLLCLGDVVAVRTYHRHADWRVLARLLPGVVPGIVVGAWFLTVADDTLVRKAIAATLLAMVLLQLWMRRGQLPRRSEQSAVEPRSGRRRPGDGVHGTTTATVGAVAGFATMTANAAGAVTSLYLVLVGLPVRTFLGTAAWFYLIVNAVKLPISVGLGLVTARSIALNVALVPALLVGAAAGVWAIRRLDQRRFELVVLGSTAVTAAALWW